MKYKNNPYNIRYDGHSKWLGLSGHKNGFCEFDSLFSGVRVCVYLLECTYKKRGILSMNDIIHTFAPAEDGNDPDAYLSAVCKSAGISRSDIFINLNFDLKTRVLQAMALIESCTTLDDALIKRVYYCF